jgi:hypothetical protein
MKGIVAIAIAAAFFAFPAAAQNATKGKSSTAPGQTGLTPGQEKPDQGGAKNLAPGQNKQSLGAQRILRQVLIKGKRNSRLRCDFFPSTAAADRSGAGRNCCGAMGAGRRRQLWVSRDARQSSDGRCH